MCLLRGTDCVFKWSSLRFVFKGLISSGSKEEEPRYVRLSEAEVSHSQWVWAEVSSSVLQLLKEMLVSHIKWRCLLRVSGSAWGPTATLDCVAIGDKIPVFLRCSEVNADKNNFGNLALFHLVEVKDSYINILCILRQWGKIKYVVKGQRNKDTRNHIEEKKRMSEGIKEQENNKLFLHDVM